VDTNSSHEDQLERFLDGLMTPEEAAVFSKSIEPDQRGHAMELQSQVDDSLKRLVSQFQLDERKIEQQFLDAHGPSTSIDHSSSFGYSAPPVAAQSVGNSRWIGLAIAASLMLALGLGMWFAGSKLVNPVDEPRQVAMVYQEKIDRGFLPYYICDDPDRFARNFEDKLGQPLALSEMPADRSMVGISYLGGVSRDTVAMLAKVKDEKVIVFVDQEGKPGIEEAIESSNDDLNVFVERKFGLVFVEVTPLESAGMIEHFELAK